MKTTIKVGNISDNEFNPVELSRENPLSDSFGQKIYLNDFVIFNKSGELALGQISDIRNQKWNRLNGSWFAYYKVDIKIRILKSNDESRNPPQFYSNVKNPNSLIVIDELEARRLIK